MTISTIPQGTRVGIDVGGTHTDVVIVDTDGTPLLVTKVPSNPAVPLLATREALATIPEGTPVDVFINGTTIAINALLQRKLPRVGLIATRGFGDLLYIRRETKANIYDLDWRKPEPLIPRHLTFEIDERIDAQGDVVTPLGNLDSLMEWLDEKDLDDVAVCLIHAYRNPVHERAIRDALVAGRPETRITLSSEVWPEWREFERTYNTALNAVLKPVIADYLQGLVVAVKEAAGHENVYLMHADGGRLQPSEIAQRPVLTLLSGTVAGALFGANIAEAAGYSTAVSLDMGGTSTDIGLSEHGRPRRSAELSIEWEGTLGFAGVDVASIGAGGGSIVWADEAGGIHVGPMSAGADPGPAAYDRGGMSPTLTDAYLLLGYLGPSPVIGGRRLNVDRAREAFGELVTRTGMAEERLYVGVYEIANSNLAAGIRSMTIERGVDPRSCALMCFGGAGPLHAGALVRHLGLASALVPPRPGNGSAFGLVLAPVKHGVSQTFYAPLDELPTPTFRTLIQEVRKRAIAGLPEREEVTLEWYLSLRYRGQTRELTIPLDEVSIDSFDGETRDGVVAAFHAKHEEEFTFSAESEPIQLVTVRCEASLPSQEAGLAAFHSTDGNPSEARESDETEVYFASGGADPEPHLTTVIPRNSLTSGEVVRGPAVVLDVGSTTLLPPGSTGRTDSRGNLIVEWTRDNGAA